MYRSRKGCVTDKCTIVDVARHAGVAVSTVSRVVNDKGDVSKETRQKVLESMQHLNYTPNTAARILGGGMEHDLRVGLHSIGLVTNENQANDPYFIHILRGAAKRLASEGFNCIFAQLSGVTDSDSVGLVAGLPKMLTGGNVDGVIAVGIDNLHIAEEIKRQGYPSIFVDSSDFGDGFDYIKADNQTGAKKAVSHLVSLGHKRIAYIRGVDKSWFFNELEFGYMEALRSGGLRYDAGLVFEGGNSPRLGYETANRILDLPVRPTAIFTNDITAIGVIKAIREMGLGIPEDISVVGFDDIDAAAYMEPALTTVKVLKTEMGELAAHRAVQYLKNKDNLVQSKALLPVELIVRETSGIAAD